MSLSFPHVELIRGGVIVSCQAGADSPLNAPHFISALAKSAERGGAVGFRVDRPENVAAVRAASNKPIIGINKIYEPSYSVFITPTFESAKAIVEAGADIIALDGTERLRPSGENVSEIIQRIHEELRVPVMADIGNSEEGFRAAQFGADLIATTLAYSSPYGSPSDGPAIHIARDLSRTISAPVIIEGRLWTIEDVLASFNAGAYAVVIGSAITVPEFITRRFVSALQEQRRAAG